MVIPFLMFVVGVTAEDLHSLLQARSATHLQNSNFVAQFSEKVQVASGVLSVFREESMTCAMVTRGAQAPAVGTFMRNDGAPPRAVRAPFVAPTNGKYCVEDHVFSMLQRAYGLHSAQDVEDAIGQKDQSNQNDNETEQAIGGKGGGENAESSTGSKHAQTTTTTTTTDGPGAHCADTNRRCCGAKTCDAGYEPVWDPTCEYANPWRFAEKVGCGFAYCFKCLETGDPILQTPVCPEVTTDEVTNKTIMTNEYIVCSPTYYNLPWSRGVDYEGNPYYEENLYYWAACVNETNTWKGEELTWKTPTGGVLCVGSNYRERGCTYNHHVAMNRTTEDLPPNKTIADYDWTGTVCRFLPR